MGVTGDQGNQGNQRDASVGSSGKRGTYQFALAQGAQEGTVNRRWKVILRCLRGAVGLLGRPGARVSRAGAPAAPKGRPGGRRSHGSRGSRESRGGAAPCAPLCRSRPPATAFGREGPNEHGGCPMSTGATRRRPPRSTARTIRGTTGTGTTTAAIAHPITPHHTHPDAPRRTQNNLHSLGVARRLCSGVSRWLRGQRWSPSEGPADRPPARTQAGERAPPCGWARRRRAGPHAGG